MKFGPRIPSLRKRIAARTSPARFIRHSLGLKAPRGWGWLTNPKKAAYNRIYNRTTFSVLPSGCLLPALAALALVALLAGLAFGGDEQHYYGPQGQYQGYSHPDPGIQGQTIYRDQHGKYQGYSTQTPSGETVYRDRDGKYVGREPGWPTTKSK